MKTVAANVERLIGWNRSMAVALERAEKGSEGEDQYCLETLRRSAGGLGFVLEVSAKVPERASERAMRETDGGRTKPNENTKP